MKNIIAVIIFLFTGILPIFSQPVNITGKVSEINDEGIKIPLQFVNVYWNNTLTGTVTDENGEFTIPKSTTVSNALVFSYIGYLDDTVFVDNETVFLDIVLNSTRQLDEVTVEKRMGGSYFSKLQPIHTEVITAEGLQKLPCCNLSESFENNATIDAGYSDALTGAKHIKMLGLAGVYSQMLFENIPYMRGLESSYGLSYVPGPWMESIQISKGAASVMNGYESTTGQINIEYKKPADGDPLFMNLFASSIGRLEGNLISAFPIKDRLSTSILGHVSTIQNKMDHNNDGFLDMPISNQINILNRWNYESEGNLHAQIGFSVMDESRKGGQMDFNFSEPVDNQNYYGININTRMYRIFGKLGFIYPEKPYKGLGIVTSATFFEQNSFYGLNTYSGDQFSYYANIIYQTIFRTTDHKINTGISFNYDLFKESYNNEIFDRAEIVEGIFGQYTYTLPDKFTGIAGIRIDYHNKFGLLLTPRFHIRYDLNEHTSIRASVGKGYRSANILSENTGILISSRTIYFPEDFNIEEAWNWGFNVRRDFHFNQQREITLNIDFYRTDFINQIIVDMDQDVSVVYIYNLDGRSFSNSFQAQIDAEPIERINVTMAFRLNDVRTTYHSRLLTVPLTSRYKGLLTFSYATKFDKWTFDFTGQLNGQTRLPITNMNPEEFRRSEYSPMYPIIHAQI
ncbi:MAG: TonB-dependent receptor, partial [Bacteroidales bacterium]|nr:TonB-dependent receptor [Bacteroidales bacterium]